MTRSERQKLRKIRRFDQLVAYLRDELDWPIGAESFEDLMFEYTAEELGIDSKAAAKIDEIKRMRPLTVNQPWGIFFVQFEPKRLPVVALRRVLSRVVLKKRASANKAELPAWQMGDILFVSNYGEGDQRQISFAHFSEPEETGNLPTLKVLGWDNLDTFLHLDHVADELAANLVWPDDEDDSDAWRERWRAAFTLRHREVITTSKQLSVHLAGVARAIRNRIETALSVETADGPLTKLMKAFQEALIHDLDAAGFSDMYAQTITYGLLSARIADPERKDSDDLTAHMRTNPFLKELMEAFLQAGGRNSMPRGSDIDFDELGISEVVDLLNDANMEAVVRDFGDQNPLEDPVIHFYEHFLAAYDKKQKVSRGVFYTPRPVVSYIVRSVDKLLRSEFGLEDGLADTTTWGEMAERYEGLVIPEEVAPEQDFVQILDPAAGTGTFLVEAIEVIHDTLVSKWNDQGHSHSEIRDLWNEYVPMHLLTRLHGFELMMAPYAIAHLKLGLKLYETGYRFRNSERLRVYLTNSLERVTETQQMKLTGFIPALAREAQEVYQLKKNQKFTVVVGNPPYSSLSANLTESLRKIVDPYRFVDGERIRERNMLQFEKNIQDDYVKFFSLAQGLIKDSSFGICSMISNHSYLDGPTLRGLRWSLISQFPIARFLDLHGNINKREVAPDGDDDGNVFDIRQGVAICILSLPPGEGISRRTLISELWGDRNAKYEALVGRTNEDEKWETITPEGPLFYFVPSDSSELADEWKSWPRIVDLFTKRSTGTETGFDDLLMAFTRDELKDQIERFSDPSATQDSLSQEFRTLRGHALAIFQRRSQLRRIEEGEIARFQLRAFDYRWAILRKTLLKTNSFNVMLDLGEDSPGLVTTRQTKESFAAFAVADFCGHKLITSYDRGYILPLFSNGKNSLPQKRTSHINQSLLDRFSVLYEESELDHPREEDLSKRVFAYTLALLSAPSYSKYFREKLKRHWPRVPLPRTLAILQALVPLGRLLTEVQTMASPILEANETKYVGPRSPLVRRIGWSEEVVWLDAGKIRSSEGHRATKPGTMGFEGVPEKVWDFKIGGYQVCHKWLKDRKGRTLSNEEIAHYHKIVVALSETIRIMGEIDEVIEEHGGWPDAFITEQTAPQEAVSKMAAERGPSYEAGDEG